MDLLKLLERSFNLTMASSECGDMTRAEFLAEYIFNFTTYDSEMSDLFGRKAVEICIAITKKTTFKYIEDKENYQFYLLMLNMPFFSKRIEWGASIRGAWWCGGMVTIESCGLYSEDEEQMRKIDLNQIEWIRFVEAMSEFIEK